ncbi:DHHA2 domain-containing protein [Citrus sinensis]|nr:DHHA2 domain-containing protein [Citrus sinensis]
MQDTKNYWSPQRKAGGKRGKLLFVGQQSEDKYVHGEDPYFDGLLRGDGTIKHQASNPIFRGSANSGKIYRSTSDIGKTRHKTLDLDVTEKPLDTTFEDSVSDINLEPFGPSSPGIFSKIAKRSSFSFPSDHLEDSSFDIGGDLSNSIKEPIPRNLKALEQYGTSDLMLPAFSKSYSTKRTKPNLSKIPLPQSAASFYNGFSPQMEIVESCESINRLNSYLKARKDEVSAGVPGRLLHVVIGQDVCDVGSLASTFMYAFYLNLVQENELFCTVPVINMKRADLNTRAELKWLLGSCQIDLSSLIFVDEIDLSYYDLFGSLKLVLINGHKLPTRQEALKDAVVEIFNCRKGESVYPCVETVTVGEDCSCCTVVAENFALTSPQILAGQGFSRILLAGILLDTGNLTNTQCTSKDKYMATLLINGAGRFGCNGLYQILRYLMYDVSDLKVVDILRKDFKKWKTAGKQDNVASRSVLVSHIGMSSIGISTQQLLAHEDASILEIKYFQQLEKVRLLMIVSGYYDSEKNFKREILVSAESVELMRNLLTFLNSNASQLPLKVLHQSGLKEEMKAFEIDKFTSRKTIERLLEEFGGTSKTGGISLLRD